MGADLNNIVKTQKLTDDHVQFLIYQVLRGLKYIHSAGIIHRVNHHPSSPHTPTIQLSIPLFHPLHLKLFICYIHSIAFLFSAPSIPLHTLATQSHPFSTPLYIPIP